MWRNIRDKFYKALLSVLYRVFPGLGEVALKFLYVPRLLSLAISKSSIVSIVVSGEQGVFEGSADDVSIMQKYALTQSWSPETIQSIVEAAGRSDGATYVDIGANVGLVAIPVAARGIPVMAFEPVPTNYAHLRRNAELNGVQGLVTAKNMALLEAAGEVEFELSPSNHGDHRYRRDDSVSLMGESAWETVSVKAAALDDFESELQGPLIVKIDTQGAEPLVIAGGRKVLERAVLVHCEFSPYAMERMGVDPKPLIDFFAELENVEVYEVENEVPTATLSKAALADYLTTYFEQARSEPFGHYLNLLARKS